MHFIIKWKILTAAEITLLFSAGSMQHRFWISKPLHSIAKSERKILLSFVMWCGGFFVCPKSKERNRIQSGGGGEHRIFFSRVKMDIEERLLHGKLLCGVVRRDNEHRIVSATIQSTDERRVGFTQGTPLFTSLRKKIKTEGLRKFSKKNDEKVNITFRLS